MEILLNDFQTYILRVLALVPSDYMNIWMQRAEWSRNNLRDTPEILDSWELQLIEEGYISKEKIDTNVVISGNPPKFVQEPARIKIEQKGIEYLASGFEIKMAHKNIEDRIDRLKSTVERIKKEKSIKKGNNEDEIPLQESKNLSLVECAIMHVYLGRSDSKQRINKTNSGKFALDECGLDRPSSGSHLYQEYGRYLDDNYRLSINSESKVAAKTHIQRFNNILPLLEKRSSQAFSAAKEDYKKLEKEYDKWY